MATAKKLVAALATAGLLVSGAAQAMLVDRGGGLIYDSDLNITWLQDANYAMTSGYDADGRMSWATATAWAAGLTYGGFSDWRLPTITDLGAPGCDFSYSGTDCGFNVPTNSSELAHLFYVELDNLAAYDTSGYIRGGSSGVNWGLVNRGPFQNLQSGVYWSGTAYALDPGNQARHFNTSSGLQIFGSQRNEFYAWAVRPGDVAADNSVPEPGTAALVGLALGEVAVARRRRSVGAS